MTTEVGGLVFRLGMNSASFETAAQRARREFREFQSGVRGDVQGIQSSLDKATQSLLGFGKGLVAGAAGAVGIAGVTAVVTRMVTEVREAEDAQVKLAAVLKATGFTAGLTAKQLDQFANELENSTLQSAEAIKDASSILATFKSVAGDVFTDAIRRAADLSAVFGQDLSASATQLGKALESPVEGLSALRRVGVSFTDAQKEVIAKLVETGQQAEAQRVILKTLADQVGGAAEAQRKETLTGAFTGAYNAIGDMLQRWDQITGSYPKVVAALKAVTAAADSAFHIPDTAELVQQKRAELKRAEIGGRDPILGGLRRDQAEGLRLELEGLEKKLRLEQDAENAAQLRIKANAAAAQAEANAASAKAAADAKAEQDRIAAEKAKAAAAAKAEAAARAAEAAARESARQDAEAARLRARALENLEDRLRETAGWYEKQGDLIGRFAEDEFDRTAKAAERRFDELEQLAASPRVDIADTDFKARLDEVLA